MDMEEAQMDRLSYKRVFAVHTAAGWTLKKKPKRAQGAQGTEVDVAPPAAPPQIPATEDSQDHALAAQLHAFGLATRPDACRLWGVGPTAAAAALQPDAAHRAMWTLLTAVTAARLSATVLMESRWIRPLLAVVHTQRLVLKIVLGQQKASKANTRSAAELMEFLESHATAAQECLEPGNKLSPEGAVYLCANLDALYYDLLQYYLRRGGEGPVVPPPHDYFPAITAQHNGKSMACQELLHSGISADLRQSMAETWGLVEEAGSLALPQAAAIANPLLAVMWARFQEGCRLLPGLDSGSQRRKLPGPTGADRTRLGGHKRNSGKSHQDSLPAAKSVKRRKLRQGYKTLLPGLDSNSDSDLKLSGSDSDSELASSVSESDTIFGGRDSSSSDADESAGANEPKAWPGHPALRAWRESGKECHFYAYAPPTPAALDVLAGSAPIVEIGAGCGYWAELLRRRGIKVTAYDSHPPSPQSHAPNDYHGHVPAVSRVVQGGPKALAGHAGHTLFLCYPPPGSSMALDCLRNFRGSCVAVVGEWAGDTGDAAFTAALLEGFSLKERVRLPNWSDTAHELTVWERSSGRPAGGGKKKKKKKCKEGRMESQVGRFFQVEKAEPGLPLASCAVCSVPHPILLQGGTPLMRCRWCKDVAYCSEACARRDAGRHRQLHALRWVTEDARWSDSRDYEPLLL